jgi:hypothetical protein
LLLCESTKRERVFLGENALCSFRKVVELSLGGLSIGALDKNHFIVKVAFDNSKPYLSTIIKDTMLIYVSVKQGSGLGISLNVTSERNSTVITNM